MTHTKEPWEVEADNRTEVCRSTGDELSYVAGWNITSSEREIVGCEGILGCGEANARRIVSCVNAFAGLTPEALAGLIEAATDLCADKPGARSRTLRALANIRGEA
jgi:hypothetical protein